MEYKCPYCGNKVEHMKYCIHCHHHIEWMKEILDRSNCFYNKGYYAAKERNLSQAIEYLHRAIEIYKYHTQARNLLGLVYFEIGHVGDALKEWIISQSFDKEDTLAGAYINEIQNSLKKLTAYKDAIHLYNKSLEYLKKKNIDIAIIRLKKAISVNPHLLEARVLLGLCYMQQNQFYKANEHIKAVLSIDHGHTKALYYFKELCDQDTQTVPPYELEYVSKEHTERKMRPNRVLDRSATLKYSMLYFVVGILSMFVIYHFLIVPNNVKDYKEQIAKLTESQTELSVELNNTLKVNQEKMTELELANKKLLEEKANYEQQVSGYMQKDKLSEANKLKAEGNYIAEAEVLYNVAPSLLDEESQTLYNTLKEEAYQKAASILYNEGYGLYQKGEYIEAKGKLETVLIYNPSEETIRRSLYYLGILEDKLDNRASAKNYFNKLIADYEGTYEAREAKRQIEQMQ